MTITEANAVNTLLRLCMRENPKPSCVEQIRAAQTLAKSAHKTLLAGIGPEDIAPCWPRDNDPADPTSWDAQMVERFNNGLSAVNFPEKTLPLLERVRSAGIRVESIVSLPLAGEESPSSQAVDAVEDICSSQDVWLPAGMPKLAAKLQLLCGDNDDSFDNSFEGLLLAGFHGYWVNVAHPVLVEQGKRRNYPGFGFYNTRWFYADSIDQALKGALEWAEARQAEADKLPAEEDS